MRGTSFAGKPDYKDGQWKVGPSYYCGGFMDIVGIDISKATFDAALLLGKRVRHAAFSNSYGIHAFNCVVAMRKPAAMAANCAHPACMVLGPGGL